MEEVATQSKKQQISAKKREDRRCVLFLPVFE